jgi:phenylpyruvate tautomerase PptA (4-oxalocrotonate tautomerase family)
MFASVIYIIVNMPDPNAIGVQGEPKANIKMESFTFKNIKLKLN